MQNAIGLTNATTYSDVLSCRNAHRLLDGIASRPADRLVTFLIAITNFEHALTMLSTDQPS